MLPGQQQQIQQQQALQRLSPEQRQAQQKIHALNTELHGMTQSLQVDILKRLNLQSRLEECMNLKCLDVTRRAELAIEHENSKRQTQSKSYILDTEKYMQEKFSSSDSTLAVIDAEECIRQCHRPRDIIAKTLEQNLGEFYSNIKLCFASQEKADPESKQKNIDYEGVSHCLESNITILKEMDKRLNDEFLRKSEAIFL